MMARLKIPNLKKEGLKIHKGKSGLTIYRTDGKRMTQTQMNTAATYVRRKGLFKLPK